MNIEEYSKYKHFYAEPIPKLLLKYLKKEKWTRFIDVGCGDGEFLYDINKRGLFKNKKICAGDLSQNRIETVKKINPQFKCFVNDACDLKDIKSDSVDFLVSSQVIEHVPNDETMVKAMARILDKSHNTAYISTVFKKWYGWYFYRCNGKWTLDPTHVREYTKDNQLLDILKKHNFEIVEIKKTLFWFSIARFFFRRLKLGRNIFDNKFWRLIMKIKLPIIGYNNWEIICRKK